MTLKQSNRYMSDATGRQVAVPYEIAVIYDGDAYVVDLDRENLVAEAKSLTLYDLLAHGRRRPLREMLNKRRSSVPLNAELHRRARQWALANGVEVGTRGIVSKDVLHAYQQALGLDEIVFEVPVDRDESAETAE